MDIGIVGAGPAGLFASIALTQGGHNVEIFERASVRHEAGAGIQISPNGSTLLAQLGLLSAVEPLAFAPEAATLRRVDTGQIVFSAPLGDAGRQRYGAPYLHLHRSDLTTVLERGALDRGVKIHYGCQIERYENTASRIMIHSKDNSSHTFDLLVGADGIHSTVRNQLTAQSEPRFTQHVAWRGLVSTNLVPDKLFAPDATVWAGPNAHFVHYYVRNGTLLNFVAVERRGAWTEESWQTKGDIADVRKAFAHWSPEISTLLNATESCHLWGLFDHPPLGRWTGDRVCLLGDACHPMLPFMAQGAVMAFEDAVILARALDVWSDLPTALTAYESLRKPRTVSIQEQARRNGMLFHQTSALKRELAFRPMAIANKLAPDLIARQLDWIYGYDAFRVDVTRIR